MNITVSEIEDYEGWQKLYIGLLVTGPIYLATLVIVLYFAIKWQLQSRRLEQGNMDMDLEPVEVLTPDILSHLQHS